MDRLVSTQCFNIMVEESYKMVNMKDCGGSSGVVDCGRDSLRMIEFYRNNIEVIIEYSFKRLKKEQNKMIEDTFMKLRNPVKFNVTHIFENHYKKKIKLP